MEPYVNVVRRFVVLHFLAAVFREKIADCRVDSEFFFEDVKCFVLPFVDVCIFGAMFLGDGEEFGDSVDSVRIVRKRV